MKDELNKIVPPSLQEKAIKLGRTETSVEKKYIPSTLFTSII